MANLIIGCGALMKEILTLRKINGLEKQLDVMSLPAIYHNHPQKILPALKEKVASISKGKYEKIYIGYADCGTGGELDRWIEAEGYQRLPGAHCYAFYSGLEAFDAMAEDTLGTFYLTDYLARQFDVLIMKGFRLDEKPELIAMMFSHYTKLIYLAQSENDKLDLAARAAAQKLGGLAYERIFTGYGELAGFIEQAGEA